MKYIAHRINTIEELKQLPPQFGVELDLRDLGERIVIHHDPFTDGDDFEHYLQHYKHGTMILNIKSERIEHRVLELVRKYGIDDYFFLDSSFPMIYLLAKQGEKKIALRFSEFEGLDTLEAMQGKVDWVWVDCFSYLPITAEVAGKIKAMGYKLCLVSPELQGRPDDIVRYKQQLAEQGVVFDAICTKVGNVPLWES